MPIKPEISDMFACQKCATQIQVMQTCECKSQCADFRCCGQPMENITEPTIRAADDQTLNDGVEPRPNKANSKKPIATMADQAEAAKKL